MQDAKVLTQQEVREILAEYFKVPKESVITSKYSYIIIQDEKGEKKCQTQ